MFSSYISKEYPLIKYAFGFNEIAGTRLTLSPEPQQRKQQQHSYLKI